MNDIAKMSLESAFQKPWTVKITKALWIHTCSRPNSKVNKHEVTTDTLSISIALLTGTLWWHAFARLINRISVLTILTTWGCCAKCTQIDYSRQASRTLGYLSIPCFEFRTSNCAQSCTVALSSSSDSESHSAEVGKLEVVSATASFLDACCTLSFACFQAPNRKPKWYEADPKYAITYLQTDNTLKLITTKLDSLEKLTSWECVLAVFLAMLRAPASSWSAAISRHIKIVNALTGRDCSLLATARFWALGRWPRQQDECDPYQASPHSRY